MNHRRISFAGHAVSIEFDEVEVETLIDFLFYDLEQDASLTPEASFRIYHETDSEHWKLVRDQTELFIGNELNELGNVLAGETLFSLITNNHSGIAIHAGLVSKDEKCLLLPADSGSGKTSVTTWMLTRGWQYHTDELVLIDLESGELTPFTRPLTIKPSGLQPLSEIFDIEKNKAKLRASRSATMIPHRLINPNYICQVPDLSLIVFPHYAPKLEPELRLLTRAAAGLELMRSNVIARNLPGHGFNHITQLVKSTPAYRLHYQHFSDLDSLLGNIGL